MTVRLDPADVEAIAVRVVELLHEDGAPDRTRLLTATEVARRFRLSRGFVYENADMLGVVRIGKGSRPRLRFDPEMVAEALTARSDSRGSESRKPPSRAKSRRPRRAKRAHSPDLLPIKGRPSLKPRGPR